MLRRTGVNPAPRTSRRRSSSGSRKLTPAAATTFSSIMVEPKSLAPQKSANWPIFGPWVTQEAWMFGTLSRYRRLKARKRRYSQEETSGADRLVLAGWKVQGMNAVNPTVCS